MFIIVRVLCSEKIVDFSSPPTIVRESKGSGAQKKATKSPGGIRASNCEDFSNPYFPPFFPVICWTFYLIVHKEGGCMFS